MPRLLFGFGFAVLTLVPSSAGGQTPAPASISWTTHTIKSAALGADRTYFVAVPPRYAQDSTQHAVLVLLDADDQPQFVSALANIQFLTSRDEAPGLIVVGIPNRDRTHDLTPATRAADEQKQFPTAGGAAAFLKFISDEVLPAVRASYRTLPTTFLAGHSFGGLFALYSAAARPGAFTGYVAMSPALQWSNAEYAVSLADQLLAHKQAARLFVTSGGLEPPIDVNTQRLIARLDSTPHAALALKYRRYPDDTHGLTPMPSLVDGLRFMFEPISMRETQHVLTALPRTADSAAIVRAVGELPQRYAAGARVLGMPEKLPENVLNQWGYTALQWFHSPGAAVAIFRRNIELYPGSANVYDSLGDALLAKGDTAGARTQFEKAIESARATGHPVLQESTRKLEALKKK